MASVEKYQDASGAKRFAARWRHEGRQVKVRTDPRTGQPFRSEGAARKYAQEQEADARRGITPHRSDVTVSEYARYWAGTRGHRRGTARRMKNALAHFEATGLGSRKLVDVKQSQVQAWASDRARVLAPATLRSYLGTLGSVFRSAERDHLLLKTPVHEIRLPEHDHERIVPLTVAQVEALADAMPDRYRAMVVTQAGTGLRIGELLALRVQDVNFLRRMVTVELQFIERPELDEDGRPMRSDLKTRTSKRTVPLPRHVATELASHLAKYGGGTPEDVWTTSSGRTVHHAYYGNLFRAAARKAGLPEGTSTHDLRHHYATELLGAGLTSVEVGHLLGHKDGSLVEKVYGHSRVDAADRAQAALDAAWRDGGSAAAI